MNTMQNRNAHTTHPAQRVKERYAHTQGGSRSGDMVPSAYQPTTYQTNLWSEHVPQHGPTANQPPFPSVNSYDTKLRQDGEYGTTSSVQSRGQMRYDAPFQQQDTKEPYPSTLIPSSAYQTRPLPQGAGSAQGRHSGPIRIDLTHHVQLVKKNLAHARQMKRAENPVSPQRVFQKQLDGYTRRQEVYSGASQSSYHGRSNYSNRRPDSQNEVRPNVQSRKRSYRDVDTSSHGEEVRRPAKRHREDFGYQDPLPAVQQTRHSSSKADRINNHNDPYLRDPYVGFGQHSGDQLPRTSRPQPTQSDVPQIYYGTQTEILDSCEDVRQGKSQVVSMVLPTGARIIMLRENDPLGALCTFGKQECTWLKIDKTGIEAALASVTSSSARSPVSTEDCSPAVQKRGKRAHHRPDKMIGKYRSNPIRILDDDDSVGEELSYELQGNQAKMNRAGTNSRQRYGRLEEVKGKREIQPDAPSQEPQTMRQGSRSFGTIEQEGVRRQPVVKPSMARSLSQTSNQEQTLPPQGATQFPQHALAPEGTIDPSMLCQTSSGSHQNDAEFTLSSDSQPEASTDSQQLLDNFELESGLDMGKNWLTDSLNGHPAAIGQGSFDVGPSADLPGPSFLQVDGTAPASFDSGSLGVGILPDQKPTHNDALDPPQLFHESTSSERVEDQPVEQSPEVSDDLASLFGDDGHDEPGQQTPEDEDDHDSLFEDDGQDEPGQQIPEEEDGHDSLFEDDAQDQPFEQTPEAENDDDSLFGDGNEDVEVEY